MAGRRLFAAVEIPDAERERLTDWLAAARPERNRLRVVAPHQWHVTLAFYGEVLDLDAEELEERLARAAARTAAFEIQLCGAGTFPADPARARVLWIGVDGERELLGRLAERCTAAGRRTGLDLRAERFRPHLTLARSNAGPLDLSHRIAGLTSYVGEPWRVSSFSLIHSTLGARVHHDPIAEFDLAE